MVPERRLAARRSVIPIEHPRLRGYTPMDILAAIYLTVTGIILAIGHDRVNGGGTYLLIHLGLLAATLLMRFVPRRGHILLMFFRDSYALWLLAFFYREVGVLDRIIWSGFFDAQVLQWEKAVFGLFPSVFLRDWIPSRALDEFLHFSYIMYYLLVPIVGFWLYLKGREEVCRVFASTMLLTFFTCYLIFIFFPVAGPYYVFPREASISGFFPPLVHRVLESGASKGAAFPSSHVAGAVAVFCVTLRFERELSLLMGTLALGIFLGTVYGGFHYGVDALAGLALGVVLSLVGPALHSVLLRQARLWPLSIRFPHLFDPIRRKLWGLRPRDRQETPEEKTRY
ncbi:MAG: hypothetical protein FJY88_05400 [Candidatus Eisenbacteria bacterium]|nr:hypothetical protein [Candidatus Eisenbacteria bacterium]